MSKCSLKPIFSLIFFALIVSGCNLQDPEENNQNLENEDQFPSENEDNDGEEQGLVTVTFMNSKDEVIISSEIEFGADASPPDEYPEVGYSLISWNKALEGIEEDTVFRPVTNKIFDYYTVDFKYTDGVSKIYPDKDRENVFYSVFEDQFVGDERAGIYRSYDAGEVWELIQADLNPQRLMTSKKGDFDYVYTTGLADYTIGRSVDGGDTWSYTKQNDPDASFTSLLRVRDLIISDSDPLTLLAISGYSVVRSIDGGKTWVSIIERQGYFDGLVRGANGEVLLLSNSLKDDSSNNYIMKSTDFGLSFFQSSNGLRTKYWTNFPNRNSLFLFGDLYISPNYRKIFSVNAGAGWNIEDPCTTEICEFSAGSVSGLYGPGLNHAIMNEEWYACDAYFFDSGLRLMKASDEMGDSFELISDIPYNDCLLSSTNYNALVLGFYNEISIIRFE